MRFDEIFMLFLLLTCRQMDVAELVDDVGALGSFACSWSTQNEHDIGLGHLDSQKLKPTTTTPG